MYLLVKSSYVKLLVIVWEKGNILSAVPHIRKLIQHIHNDFLPLQLCGLIHSLIHRESANCFDQLTKQ